MAKDFIENEKHPLVGKDAPIPEPDTSEQHQPRKSGVTVEPVAFLFMMGMILANTTTQQYVNYSVAERMSGDILEESAEKSTSLCAAGSETTSTSDIQEIAARILSTFSFLNILPMLIAAVLMGSYSDKQGRKVALILPVIGGLLRGIVAFVVCYWKLQVRFLYAGGLAEGFCGGTAVFTTALFAYIADVSTTDKRSWRMLVISIAQAMGISLAEISTGYMITYIGFIAPFTLILVVYSLCLLYILCFIQESVTSWSQTTGYFDVQHFVRTFRIMVSNTDPHRQWIMRCCTVILFSNFICAGIIAYRYVGTRVVNR